MAELQQNMKLREFKHNLSKLVYLLVTSWIWHRHDETKARNMTDLQEHFHEAYLHREKKLLCLDEWKSLPPDLL